MHAREANDRANWDKIWTEEGRESWRGNALADVYARIAQLIPRGARVIDIGGGVGQLATILRDEARCEVEVWDHSTSAVEQARRAGFSARVVDLLSDEWGYVQASSCYIATEVLEHMPAEVVDRILSSAKLLGMPCFFSVPNDRLGPDEEPQHDRKWTALEFLHKLREVWGQDCRVECLGPLAERGQPAFLLGICGPGTRKAYTLSMTLPVRDEAKDLEVTLASFRGVADEIVVGVDPRTKDDTREVAAKYADVVFDIVNPRGLNPDVDKIPDNGVHFAHIRNECIDKCTSEWIFMTEGHEKLDAGVDALLGLSAETMCSAKVAFVWRTGGGQRWAYPWLFRKDTRIRFERATHNNLDYPVDALLVKLPQVRTLHKRHADNAAERSKQRKAQNRRTLLDDWVTKGNANSLYYLASEMRDFSSAKACERMREYLSLPTKNGPARYQTRLQLALELVKDAAGDITPIKRSALRREVREVLVRATEDDWSRVEHWMWLGDLAFEDDQFEEAHQFYSYAAARIDKHPFSTWWIDEDAYSYLPAQRMAMSSAALGFVDDALMWAKRARELLPDNAPQECIDEAEENVRLIEQAIAGTEPPHAPPELDVNALVHELADCPDIPPCKLNTGPGHYPQCAGEGCPHCDALDAGDCTP